MTANTTAKLAIIGYSGIFPQADSPEMLWQLLDTNKKTFSEIPQDRWSIEGFYSKDRFAHNKSSSKWMAAIALPEAKQRIWPDFPSAEHATVDPQQLLLLCETKRALEHAGLSTDALSGKRVSVSVGCMDSDNMHNQIQSELPVSPGTVFGNYQALLANRISQHFGFTGESKAINTACSASFMALSDARSQLINHRADYAIVAAANLNIHPLKYYAFSKAGMLSPSGSCTPFDITADGYVPGDCVAVLCVTTLDQAIKRNHHIYGVIEGMAGNHNGNRALSPTAPSVPAQIELLKMALDDAEISAQEVSYIEAHGTGTSLGDPLEIEALAHVYGHHACHVGSVKGVIGHTEAAAGLAAIIKTLLMFRFQTIPGNHWVRTINPLVDERLAQLQIAKKSQCWTTATKRIAGISSFGSGGANGHIIISEWHALQRDTATNPLQQGLYLSETSYAPSHNLFGWLSDKQWQPNPNKDTFCQSVFLVRENKAVQLQPLTEIPLVNDANLNEFSSLAHLILCPVAIVCKHKRSASSGADLLTQLPAGSLYIDRSGMNARLPTFFVEELASLPNLIENLSPMWLYKAKELERYQFTFKLLVARWKKFLPESADENGERLAYAMAYTDLYHKWSLVPKTVPACLGVVKKLLNAGICQERQFTRWFCLQENIVDSLLHALVEHIIAGKGLPIDIFEYGMPETIVSRVFPLNDNIAAPDKKEDLQNLIARSWIGHPYPVNSLTNNDNFSFKMLFSD